MESSLNYRNNSPQSNNLSFQTRSKISNLTNNVNTDSTVTSNSSTTVVIGKDLHKDIMNNSENISAYENSRKIDKDITIKPTYSNFEDNLPYNALLESQKQKDTDSDNDISPVFESPNTLKKNLLNRDKARGYISENKNMSISKSFSGNNVTTGFKQKRSIGQLRKQLGAPVPLPYLDKGGSKTITGSSNTILSTRPSVKYVSPIRKQAISHKMTAHSLASTSSPKLLTVDKLEKKQDIVTNRWRNLLIKDKIKVEDRLKQLKLMERENINKNDSVQSTKKLQHLISVNKEDTAVNLNESSNDLSTIETDIARVGEKDNYKELYNLGNGSDFNELSILELQEEIRKNAYKLDLIISLLKGDKEEDITSINQVLPKWNKFVNFRFSKYNILWTVCIIILLLCQIYVLKYL